MFEVTIEASFSAAHRLRHYRGKCENLHGHNWKVAVSVVSDKLNKSGMAIDFQELKELTWKVLKKMDHRFLNDLPEFKKVNPTSENIAKFLYGKLKGAVERRGVKLHRVKIWESEGSSVSYEKDRGRENH